MDEKVIFQPDKLTRINHDSDRITGWIVICLSFHKIFSETEFSPLMMLSSQHLLT